MSGSGRNAAPTVSRDYRPEPDDCARALELLLSHSQTSKGGPHDLTNDPTPKTVKNGPRKTEQENT